MMVTYLSVLTLAAQVPDFVSPLFIYGKFVEKIVEFFNGCLDNLGQTIQR